MSIRPTNDIRDYFNPVQNTEFDEESVDDAHEDQPPPPPQKPVVPFERGNAIGRKLLF